MATIAENLQAIKEAVYGEEVRGAIHDSIRQCYEDVSASKTLADSAAASATEKAALADQKATVANTAAQTASAAASTANDAAATANQKASAANDAATAANQKAAAATTAAQAANTAADLANEKAALAESKASAAQSAAESATNAASAANTAADSATTAADSANTKATLADQKATAANTAAKSANTAASAANTAAAAITGMTVEAVTKLPTADASAEITNQNGAYHIAFGIPTGDTGATPNLHFSAETGDPGTEVSIDVSGTAEDKYITLRIPRGIPGAGSVSAVDSLYPDENGNVALGALKAADVVSNLTTNTAGKVLAASQGKALEDKKLDKTGLAAAMAAASYTAEQQSQIRSRLGAMKDTQAAGSSVKPVYFVGGVPVSCDRELLRVLDFTVTLPASGWSDTAPYTQTVTVEGLPEVDRPTADWDFSGATLDNYEALAEGFACITRLVTAAGSLTAYCYAEKPTVDLSVFLKAVL